MAKRMWKARFVFYLWLIALPQLLLGFALLLIPELLTNYAFFATPIAAEAEATGASAADALLLTERMLGLTLVILVFILLATRSNPGQNREFVFWIAVSQLAQAALVLAGPFWFELRWWAAAPAGAIWAAGAFFLLAFASRNLLVRE